MSGAHMGNPGSSPLSHLHQLCQIRGQLQVPGTGTSPGLRLSCQVQQSSLRTREAGTLQEQGHWPQRGRQAGVLESPSRGRDLGVAVTQGERGEWKWTNIHFHGFSVFSCS